jgi:alpha-N-arabinofuranosidase
LLNRIKVDPDRVLGAIDRKIFGSFVEHLGRCVYGGIHDPESPLADANGLRSDVRAAIERLRISTIRYPGGNFVSGYRWRDGVGPVADRPTRPDLAWHAIEPNTFGTNEFIRFCRTVGAEPYLVVNAGDGDLREARDWVEYCNGTRDTALARLRRAHGSDDPHGVRYWGIGNEVDGHWQIGAKTAAEYARTYHEFAKVMRWTDPSIQLIAAATSDWDVDVVERAQALVEEAGDLIDYMSIHWYVASGTGRAAIRSRSRSTSGTSGIGPRARTRAPRHPCSRSNTTWRTRWSSRCISTPSSGTRRPSAWRTSPSSST